jgi:mannan endo-1,4-beta-mannosidase
MKSRHQHYKVHHFLGAGLLTWFFIVGLFFGSVYLLGGGSSAAISYISRSGDKLIYQGKPYKFTGTNAYSISTYWSVNRGCGSQFSDAQLDDLFKDMAPAGAVRFWAFQDFAINKNTGVRDWTGIDRVFAAAERNNAKVIPVLADNWDHCEPGKDVAWYGGGYSTPLNGANYGGLTTRVSYADYITEVIGRYKNSPSIAFWEPVNEAGGGWDYGAGRCTGRDELKGFFEVTTRRIKQLDPNRLVSSGLIGGNQCAVTGDDWNYVFQSGDIDIYTINNYGSPEWDTAVGGTFIYRKPYAVAFNRPIIIKEAAIGFGTGNDWSASAPCKYATPADRLAAVRAKIAAQDAAGSSGFMWWNYEIVTTGAGTCDTGITSTDPLSKFLGSYYYVAPAPPTPTPAPNPNPTTQPPATTSQITSQATPQSSPISPATPATAPENTIQQYSSAPISKPDKSDEFITGYKPADVPSLTSKKKIIPNALAAAVTILGTISVAIGSVIVWRLHLAGLILPIHYHHKSMIIFPH